MWWSFSDVQLSHFPDALSRLTSSDSGGGCGVGSCVTPNAKYLFGAALILLVFTAPQGEIKFCVDDVGNPRMKRGITLNGGLCREGISVAMPSNSVKTPFPLKPDHCEKRSTICQQGVSCDISERRQPWVVRRWDLTMVVALTGGNIYVGWRTTRSSDRMCFIIAA